jgi:bifunctional non-homologous end joining protein LigD
MSADVASLDIAGHRIELSNLDKVFFPTSGLTKGDLVEYYRRIAPVALPHFRNRPLSMQRFPDGISGKSFFHKDAPEYFPDWIERVELEKQDGTISHVVANDGATLVYLANQACITPHLTLARSDRPHRPDRMIFDLDPSDDDFPKVVEAARLMRSRLDALALTAYVATTGSRGLHVVVPLDRSVGFETVSSFAHAVAARAAEEHSDLLTIEPRKKNRRDRVYIDYLRNAYGQTAVAPYAVRALEGAPVATPLRWNELGNSALTARKYTIENLFRRLAQTSDPWAEIARHGQSLAGARRCLGAD